MQIKYSKAQLFFIKLILPIYKWYCNRKWQKKWRDYLATHSQIFLNLGAASTSYKDWFATDIQIVNQEIIQINVFHFDLTDIQDYQKHLGSRKINRVLAEHVLEHLTLSQIDQMLKNIIQFADSDINIRIAVPDGFHKDQLYIDEVKPGGWGMGAYDHKNLFTYQSLAEIFEKNGFQAHLVEYWDENGDFHQGYHNDENGYIKRCFINDPRNQDGYPHYTSLIIDFTQK